MLAWLARATLDVIGEAGKSCYRLSYRWTSVDDDRWSFEGFGYFFNSLTSAATGQNSESELAAAFTVIFDSARKFRVITILQIWFPVLRVFVSLPFLFLR